MLASCSGGEERRGEELECVTLRSSFAAASLASISTAMGELVQQEATIFFVETIGLFWWFLSSDLHKYAPTPLHPVPRSSAWSIIVLPPQSLHCLIPVCFSVNYSCYVVFSFSFLLDCL